MKYSYEEGYHRIGFYRVVWRYIPVKSFYLMLRNSSIYLPTADKYESIDFKEGRFTDKYVNVIRNYVKYSRNEMLRDEVEDDYSDFRSEDEDVEDYLAKVLAARETASISCWTLYEDENERMWNSFAIEKTGYC